MHDKTCRLVPVVSALALVSSALLAGAGTALAKPEPSADLGSVICEVGSEGTYYRAPIDLGANKGHWVYLSAELDFDGLLADRAPWGRYDVNKPVELSESIAGVPTTATVTIELGDRKGATVYHQWEICTD